MPPPLAHARQPVHPGGAGQPHQHRLCLVVRRVAKRHEVDAPRFGPVRDEIVARAPGGILKVALAVPAAPGQRVMGMAQSAGKPGHDPRLVGRLCPQPVIDGDHMQADVVEFVREIRKQHQQRGGIAPPRHGHPDPLGRGRQKMPGHDLAQQAIRCGEVAVHQGQFRAAISLLASAT